MADESDKIGQDEIEELLRQAQASIADSPAAKPETAGESPLERDEVEALLQSEAAKGAKAYPRHETAAASKGGVATASRSAAATLSDALQGSDMELLLRNAQAALASVNDPNDDLPDGISPYQLAELSGTPASTEKATLDLLRDVELDLKIELGRTHMYLEDVLKLRRGSVVPLDKLAGDPVDVYVNGRLIARGEVLVLNDNFCVRVAELIEGDAT